MLYRRWLLIGLIWLALSMPVLGQEAVTLKWEFQKGKPFFQEVTTETKQTMKVMGKDITQTQKQTFIFSWTPKDQDKDKNWIVAQKIESATTNPGANAGAAVADFFKALIGSEVELMISPDMEVLSIKGREKFVNKLVKANPQMESLLEQILGEEALKQMAVPAFALMPEKEVKKNDTWEKKTILNMGTIGTYDTTYKYTYEGKENKLDKIKVDTEMTYQPPGANASGNLPFKIQSAKLGSKGGTGVILFDNEKHRLESSEMKLKLEGNLTHQR